MTSDGRQETHRYSDVQMKFIGFLLAVSLSLLGWGFNNWGKAVESGMHEVMQKLNRIETRAEKRDEQIYNLAKEVGVMTERQHMMQRQLDRNSE